MSHFIIGLTGGIGSGKSTVAALFAACGVTVVDADVVARQLTAPGSAALKAICDKFGHQLLNADGSLQRAALRELIFADPAAKAWLNALLHPRIRQQMQAELAAAPSAYAILMAPLLLENQLEAFVDQVLVVDVSEQTQLARTIHRDQNSVELVQAIMASQCSRAERQAKADQLLSNEGPATDLPPQVAVLHQQYLQMAKEKLAKSLT